ncbi:DUF418 domain-containing protein [Paenibacillus sp. DYY-L-2]|uniref:DUF418 domain-containing protein n=1 Tax=Paenibacillus sp. DYY-L-2 TaxID=3447013 RepID=UPI003F4F6AF2
MNQPAATNVRYPFLDLFRGFALLGLPFVNVLSLWLIRTPENTAEFWIQRGLYFFVEARFYTIFTFLFGLGFFIFLSRSAAKNEHGKPRIRLYVRRLILLLAIGVIHQFFQSGEALFYYASFGLLVLPLYYAPRRVNLGIGLIGLILAAGAGVKFLTIPFLIVLGLAAGQYGLIQAIHKGLSSLRRIWVASLIGTVIGIGAMWWAAPSEPMPTFLYAVEDMETQPVLQAAFNVAHLGVATGPIVSVFYLTSILLLNNTRVGARLLQPLEAYGRMALSNYIGQTVLLIGIQKIFLGMETTSYVVSTLVSLGIVVVQIIVSNLWMRRFRFGPLEWLWRCGTYWEIVPMRKG